MCKVGSLYNQVYYLYDFVGIKLRLEKLGVQLGYKSVLKFLKCIIFLMLVIEFGESDIIMIDVSYGGGFGLSGISIFRFFIKKV